MSKARGLADLGNAYSDGALSNRNVIINGNFDVWQRGVADVTSDTYFADRWVMSRSGATATASQESFALGQTDVPNNPSFYAKLNVTTGNNQARIEQRVEDVTTFAGQTATLSFYAKGTNPNSGNVEIFLAHRYGTGGSTSVNVVDTITLTGNWQRFKVTLDIPSVSGKTIGDGNYVQIAWRQPDTDTSTDAWDISLSQVQLELGDTATPFEHRSYGDELQRCSRYAHVLKPEQAFGRYRASYSDTGTSCNTFYEFPVEMRSLPTLTSNNMSSSTFQCYSETDGGFYNPTSAFTLGESSKRHVYMACNTATATAGAVGMWRWNNNPSASMVFDAEL